MATYFYPRPPRGGRQAQKFPGEEAGQISIHALREEGDVCNPPQSWIYLISIHALREEGDGGSGTHLRPAGDFYPRPPRGGRLTQAIRGPWQTYFYPRPPRGGRLERARPDRQNSGNFYPRPPRGGRRRILPTRRTPARFLSTPSARRATLGRRNLDDGNIISIHALREEGDGGCRRTAR